MYKSGGRDRDRDRDRDRGDRGDREGRERFQRKRVCRFCAEPRMRIDYKDAKALMPFITERGRLVPRRITSTCAYHQRQINVAVKRARILAIVPFTATQVKW